MVLINPIDSLFLSTVKNLEKENFEVGREADIRKTILRKEKY
jgi:hypothetical protein